MEQRRKMVHEMLRNAGATPNYTGYAYLAEAVCLACGSRENLMITKGIYPKVAARFGTSIHAVERNIRTVLEVSWNRNPGFWLGLACYPAQKRPGAGQLIGLMALHIRMQEYIDERISG